MSEVVKRRGAYLPHWTRDGAWYAVTFRLWDALPQHVLESWQFERENIVKTAKQLGRQLSTVEEQRLARLDSQKLERYLDAGHGACHLKDVRIATLVQNALFHFDDQRYAMAAWCLMPNHVHVVVQPFAGMKTTSGMPVLRSELPDILHSWKSFTAKQANNLLRRSGEFWQAEYYDHLIRDEADFLHTVRYVLDNPKIAGLGNWKWVGLTESGKHILREITHGRDARATRRGE
jgi:REP element-mobilizing transposase RayT